MRKLIMPAVVLVALCLALLAVHPSSSARVYARETSGLWLPITFQRYLTPVAFNETIYWNISAVNAPGAWAGPPANPRGTGRDIVIAILDTGADLDHPDLQPNLLRGRSYHAATPDDQVGHGTHVSGSAGAVANNGGVIGVAPYAKLLPVQVLGAQGGTATQVADGIRWAADNGADIINMSLGSVVSSITIENAINYASAQNVLLIAAAGNCGGASYEANRCQYQNQPSFPAAYGNVVAVAATTSLNGHASFSTQGAYVEVAAPGDSVYSTIPGGSYQYNSGTSMASPHAAGVAALIWSYNPNLIANDVRVALRSTATDLGPAGKDPAFGYGLVNAQAALNSVAARGAVAAPQAYDDRVVDPFSVAAGDYVAGELLVKPVAYPTAASTVAETRAATAMVAQAAAEQGINVLAVEAIDALGLLLVRVPAGQEAAAVAALNAAAGIAYAELNIILRPY